MTRFKVTTDQGVKEITDKNLEKKMEKENYSYKILEFYAIFGFFK